MDDQDSHGPSPFPNPPRSERRGADASPPPPPATDLAPISPPLSRAPSPGNVRPGILQASTTLTLIDGILNLVWALFAGILLTCTTIVCGIFAVYPLVLGILEIIEAQKLSRHPPQRDEVPIWLGVMQLINAMSGNPLSLVAGIITLVAANDDNVKNYLLAWRYGQGTAQPGQAFRCHRCGYDLRGSLAAGTTQCPECGAELELIERARQSIHSGG